MCECAFINLTSQKKDEEQTNKARREETETGFAKIEKQKKRKKTKIV